MESFKFYERLCWRHFPTKTCIALFLAGFTILTTIYCVFLTKFTAGVCVALHNGAPGLTVGDASITTALSRSFYEN